MRYFALVLFIVNNILLFAYVIWWIFAINKRYEIIIKITTTFRDYDYGLRG